MNNFKLKERKSLKTAGGPQFQLHDFPNKDNMCSVEQGDAQEEEDRTASRSKALERAYHSARPASQAAAASLQPLPQGCWR